MAVFVFAASHRGPVPFEGVELVGPEEELVETEAVVIGNGLHPCAFHVDGDAAFLLALLYFRFRLFEERIRRPALPRKIRDAVVFEKRLDEGVVPNLDVVGGRDVVIGKALRRGRRTSAP